MTALEVRGFRNTSKKLVEAEERTRMLKELLKNNVGLNEEEEFMQNSISKLRILAKKGKFMEKKHEELVNLTMKHKIRDNILYGVKLRRKLVVQWCCEGKILTLMSLFIQFRQHHSHLLC